MQEVVMNRGQQRRQMTLSLLEIDHSQAVPEECDSLIQE